MKRYLCALTIILIIIILGLYKSGIALFEYHGKQEGEFIATIEQNAKEKEYTNLYIAKIEGKKFIIYINKNKEVLKVGDKIKFNGKFQEPDKSRNEGGFNYKLYLKTKKIYGIFKVEKFKTINEKDNISAILKKFISTIQEKIKEIFQKNLKEENASLLIGLILGQKDFIKEDIIDNFKSSSLSHILAISGAHFSYIMFALYITEKIIRRKRFTQILSIIFILFYMQLTGGTSSVLRAGIMSICIIISSMLLRKNDIWTSLSLSALIQIIINPYVIFDIGFLFSYGGVIGVYCFYNAIQSIIKSKTLSVTLSANSIIMPIMIYNFNQLSLLFLVSNFFASIILGPVILLGIISTIFRFKIIYIILDVLLMLMQNIANFFANFTFSKIIIPTPNFLSIIFYYVLIFTLAIKALRKTREDNKNAWLHEKNKKLFKIRKNTKRTIAFLIVLMILTNQNVTVIELKINKNLLINFVDVGQGDCSLIRIEDKTLMIDSGGNTEKNSKYDLGKSTLLPYLLYKKITKLNYIMISHFDADHSQGFMYVMKNIKVENAIISKQIKETDLYNEFKTICKEKKINIIYVQNGDELNINSVTLKILHPQKEIISSNLLNNNAIVCKLIYNNFSMLFTGDIEKEAEQIILGKQINLNATILKVAHHGSKTSSTEEFIKQVNPKIILIGVGKNNKFGHPNQEVLERLKNISLQIYRTDLHGEILITITSKRKH